MDFEIYTGTDNIRRVNIGDKAFRLSPPLGEEIKYDPLDGRQKGFVLSGDYGEIARAFAYACKEEGVCTYFAWTGVINQLGDHGSVSPWVKPKERNFRR